MNIAVASGKGGTGKTTIATNLAVSLSRKGLRVQYLDCDGEEPNGHIFLKPELTRSEDVTVPVPAVDEDLCNGCGRCGDFCRYGAITCVKGKVLTFKELCHSCGGCVAVCPEGAVSEKARKIGIAEFGSSDGIWFAQGILDTGAVQTPALIKYVRKHALEDAVCIIDAPPGTSCPVIEAVKNTDFVLLATEPTPFGLSDLKVAVGMVRRLGLPFGVAINRCDIGDDEVEKYCEVEDIDIMLRIPNSRKVAEAYSRGEMMADVLPEYEEKFFTLYGNIKIQIGNGNTGNERTGCHQR